MYDESITEGLPRKGHTVAMFGFAKSLWKMVVSKLGAIGRDKRVRPVFSIRSSKFNPIRN